jgi:DNA-binding CsgD family transcriptional regulator
MPTDIDPTARGRLLEEYARSCVATDHNAEAAEAFEAAQGAYLAAGLRLEAAAVTAPLVAVRHLLGASLEERSAMLRTALRGVDTPPGLHQPPIDPASDRVRGQLLAGLAAAYMLDRRLEEATAYAIDAQRLARATDDGPTERNAAVTLSACFVFAGRMEEGWALAEDSIAGTRASGLEAEAARAYRMLGSSASVVVDYERAEKWLREGIEYAERVELWNHRHYMAAHLAHVMWATGRWDEADAIARASLGDGRGGVTTRITALHVLGYVALGRGDHATAQATLGEALDLGAGMHELQRLSPAVWGLAEAAWLTGDLATAASLAHEGLEASAAVEDAAYLFPFVVTGTRVHLLAGDPLGARRWLAEVDPVLRRRGIPGTLPALTHAQGLILTADGATGQARTELEAAVAAWDDLGRIWEGTWARIDLARCHRRSNQRTEAQRDAGIAREAAARLGSPSLIAAADEILAGRRLGASSGEPWTPLTAREFEVARLVAEGYTNAQIAAELGVAPKTASAHIEHILAKLGIGRRAEIATWVAGRPVLHSRPHGDDREE